MHISVRWVALALFHPSPQLAQRSGEGQAAELALRFGVMCRVDWTCEGGGFFGDMVGIIILFSKGRYVILTRIETHHLEDMIISLIGVCYARNKPIFRHHHSDVL